ncbi:MAG: HAMP domain-containing sensor histidine kinase [Planctomycetaceae bacterium]
MRSPLRNQIFFPIAGLLVLAVVLFTGISAWHAVEVRRGQTAQHMEAVARVLGSASYPLTDDVVSRMGAMIGGHVVVLNDQQQVTASTLAASEILRNLLAALPSATEQASTPQEVRWDSDSYLVTSIRRLRYRQPATLFVILRQDEFPVVWRNSIFAPLIVATVILVLALLLAMLISGRVAGRVNQLRALFGRLALGDFQAVTPAGRDDEIRDLMESANTLSEQLRSMQQDLLSAQRLQLLGQLSGGLAHQLKNSVAGARLAIQLHQRRCTSDDPMIQTALAQLTLTEEQVLAVVSLKAERNTSNGGAVCDLSRLMREVFALLQPHCSHWKSRMTLDAPNSLPVALKSPQSLKGGLLNLTQNAIEAAGVGGTVTCRTACDGESVIIELRDSGAGFLLDKDELAGAFRTTKPEGIGLGLTIAQHAVDQENGSLTIDRIYDQTRVVIRIPWQQPEVVPCTSPADHVGMAEKVSGP